MREEGATNDGRIKQIRDCIELSLPKIQKLLPFLNSKRWCWGGGGGGGGKGCILYNCHSLGVVVSLLTLRIMNIITGNYAYYYYTV